MKGYKFIEVHAKSDNSLYLINVDSIGGIMHKPEKGGCYIYGLEFDGLLLVTKEDYSQIKEKLNQVGECV